MLGAELAQAPDAAPSRLRRFPWAMAGAFGLLHELGQLAFVGLVRAAGLLQ